MIKGYTVHLDVNGKAACGVVPRKNPWGPSLHKALNYVTCPKCEKIAKTAK